MILTSPEITKTGRYRKLKESIPASFWHSPASMSGHHRAGQTQEHHARNVMRIAALLWRRVPWEAVRCDRGIYHSFLLAAYFHDIGKFRNRKYHDYDGWRMIVEYDRLAAFMVLLHMGRWKTEEVARLQNSEILREYQQSRIARYLAELIQQADYFDAVVWKLDLDEGL